MRSGSVERFTFFAICVSVIVNDAIAGDAKDFCESLGIYSSGPILPLFSSATTLTDDKNEQTKLFTKCEDVTRTGLTKVNKALMEMIIDSYGTQNNIAYALIAIDEIEQLCNVLGQFSDNNTKVWFFWLVQDMEHKAEIANRLGTFLSASTWNKLLNEESTVHVIKHAVDLDKIVEHERYDILFTTYVYWLQSFKESACKESTLMAILQLIDQRVTPTDIKEDEFARYLFGKICAKTYTTKFGKYQNHQPIHLNDVKYVLNDFDIKEIITHEKIIDAPIEVLKTILEPSDEYVEAMGKDRKWSYPAINAEIGQCKTEKCAKLTFKIIHLGSKTNLPLEYFRDYIEQTLNINMTREDAVEFFNDLLKIERNPLLSEWSQTDIKAIIALYNWQKMPENPWTNIETLINTSITLKWSKDFLYSFLKRTENIKLYAKYYDTFLRVTRETESYRITSVLDLLENANIRDHTLWERIEKKNLDLQLADLALLSKSSCEAKTTLYNFLTNLDISSCSVGVLTEIARCVKENDHYTHMFYYEVFERACKSVNISNDKIMLLFKDAETSLSSKGTEVRIKNLAGGK